MFTMQNLLDEVGSGKPLMPERAEWLRQLLRSAVASTERKIAFFKSFKPSPAGEADWPPGSIEGSIEIQRRKLETYTKALDQIGQ